MVTEVGERLTRCFLSVLPNLETETIRDMNVTALSDVDSWASATLVAVIDEEFGINLSLDQLWELGTFQAIERFLIQQGAIRVESDETGR